MKKIIILLSFALFLFPISINAQTVVNNEISILLDGKNVELDQSPIIENGRTLVPVRAILESLGASLDFEESTGTIKAVRENDEIILVVGNNEATINGKNQSLDVPARILNGRTLVPVRFIAENFNLMVDWNEMNQQVILTTIKETPVGQIPDRAVYSDTANQTPGQFYVEGDDDYIYNGPSEVLGRIYISEIGDYIYLNESYDSIMKKFNNDYTTTYNPYTQGNIYNFCNGNYNVVFNSSNKSKEIRTNVQGTTILGQTIGQSFNLKSPWKVNGTFAGTTTYGASYKVNGKSMDIATTNQMTSIAFSWY